MLRPLFSNLKWCFNSDRLHVYESACGEFACHLQCIRACTGRPSQRLRIRREGGQPRRASAPGVRTFLPPSKLEDLRLPRSSSFRPPRLDVEACSPSSISEDGIEDAEPTTALHDLFLRSRICCVRRRRETTPRDVASPRPVQRGPGAAPDPNMM